MESWDCFMKFGLSLVNVCGRRLAAASLERSLLSLLGLWCNKPELFREHMRQAGAVIVDAACDALLHNRIQQWEKQVAIKVVLPRQTYPDFLTFLVIELLGFCSQ